MSGILRVFVKRTSYTPDDPLVRIGSPEAFDVGIDVDEIHISVPFTWDMDEAEQLAEEWEAVARKPVKIGGPAYSSPAFDFVPGMYVRKGIVFTSRGCNNDCPWCGVRKMEGKLRELPVCEGNVIQDNNEMWMDDNPDAKICCDRKVTETGFIHRVYIERRTDERKGMAQPSEEH